jgi:hypothetical protein
MKISFGIFESETAKFLSGKEKVFCGPFKSPYGIRIEADFDSVEFARKETFDWLIGRMNNENGKIIIHFGIKEKDMIKFQAGQEVVFGNPFEGKMDFTADVNELEFTETTVRRKK